MLRQVELTNRDDRWIGIAMINSPHIMRTPPMGFRRAGSLTMERSGIDDSLRPMHRGALMRLDGRRMTLNVAAGLFIVTLFIPVRATAQVHAVIENIVGTIKSAIPDFSPGELSTAPSALPPASGNGLHKDAFEFTNRYFSLASSGANVTSGGLVKMYDSSVNYYGRNVDRVAIFRDKRKSLARWPVRDYTPLSDTLQASCDEQSRRCIARGVVAYSYWNAERNQQQTGKWAFEFGISFQGSTPSIFSESGREVSRD